jgi:hypothetical protein
MNVVIYFAMKKREMKLRKNNIKHFFINQLIMCFLHFLSDTARSSGCKKSTQRVIEYQQKKQSTLHKTVQFFDISLQFTTMLDCQCQKYLIEEIFQNSQLFDCTCVKSIQLSLNGIFSEI